MNKEIPEELLKQIEEACVKFAYENAGVSDSNQYEFLATKIKYSFFEGAKFALSLSPSSGEGDKGGKEPRWLDLTLSELVEQSLKLGYVPIFKFVDKADEAEPRNPPNHNQ